MVRDRAHVAIHHAWAAGKLVCRYLMRRCDNSPAPWDSGTAGDGEWLQALPAHATQEMEGGQDIHLPQGQPYWDFDVGRQLWQWARSPAVGKDKATPHRKPSAQQEVTSVRYRCCPLVPCATAVGRSAPGDHCLHRYKR